MWLNNQQEAFGRNISPAPDAVTTVIVHTKLVLIHKEAKHHGEQKAHNKMSCHSLFSMQRLDVLIMMVWNHSDLVKQNLSTVLWKWEFKYEKNIKYSGKSKDLI